METREVEIFWVKDVYYFENSKERHYLCHDNTFVYDSNGDQIEYWKRVPGKTYYIIPLSKVCDDQVRQNFLIADVDISETASIIMLNGEKVPATATLKVGWFYGWVKSNFQLPFKYSIEGLFDLIIKPKTRMGRNKTFFTLEDLTSSTTSYDNHRQKIQEVEAMSKKMPITRKYHKFVTTLPEDFPTKKWKKERSSNVHFGQLKLLLAEIEFLTTVSTAHAQPVLVLYPGGGPGDHVPLLSQMFPNLYFILIDPVFGVEPHTVKIVPDDKIIIRSELFTEEYISQFRGLDIPIAMISDIRSTPSTGKKGSESYEKEFEKHAKFDMELQQKWFKDLKGPDTLLKFRLPYTPGDTKYLCGSLYLQAYPPELSTEMRLVPEVKECIYQNTEIEEKLFYFNTEYRPSHFYDIDPLFGKNYDTLRQSEILGKFLVWRGVEANQRNIFNMIVIIDNFFGRRRISEYILH